MKTVLVLLFAGLCVTPALADNNNINSWIKPTSGYWEEQSSWSLGVPTNSPSIYITNSGWKAVGISATTATNYPSSMSVSDLTIRGAWDTVNTLLLQYAGTDVPFTVANGLIAADGGRIVNFDSALIVQSGTIIVTNSEIVQDGGFIRTTNATMYLQNAEYDLTNGVFEAGTVSIGTPAHSYFNQYGGAAMITDLGFGRGGGGYLLYGGTLDLPGGLPLIGRPGGVGYFQSGGTNRTLNVLMEDDYAGSSPNATLNGGLLAAGNVDVHSGWFGQSTLTQNGGTHIVTNALNVAGGASEGAYVKRAAYYLNSGALAAGSIELNANGGDSLFVQTNGSTSAGTFYAHSLGYYGSFNDYITLMGGSLTCSNFTLDDGRGCFTQSGGELVVSNLLTITGYRDLNIRYYGLY